MTLAALSGSLVWAQPARVAVKAPTGMAGVPVRPQSGLGAPGFSNAPSLSPSLSALAPLPAPSAAVPAAVAAAVQVAAPITAKPAAANVPESTPLPAAPAPTLQEPTAERSSLSTQRLAMPSGRELSIVRLDVRAWDGTAPRGDAEGLLISLDSRERDFKLNLGTDRRLEYALLDRRGRVIEVRRGVTPGEEVEGLARFVLALPDAAAAGLRRGRVIPLPEDSAAAMLARDVLEARISPANAARIIRRASERDSDQERLSLLDAVSEEIRARAPDRRAGRTAIQATAEAILGLYAPESSAAGWAAWRAPRAWLSAKPPRTRVTALLRLIYFLPLAAVHEGGHYLAARLTGGSVYGFRIFLNEKAFINAALHSRKSAVATVVAGPLAQAAVGLATAAAVLPVALAPDAGIWGLAAAAAALLLGAAGLFTAYAAVANGAGDWVILFQVLGWRRAEAVFTQAFQSSLESQAPGMAWRYYRALAKTLLTGND